MIKIEAIFIIIKCLSIVRLNLKIIFLKKMPEVLIQRL